MKDKSHKIKSQSLQEKQSDSLYWSKHDVLSLSKDQFVALLSKFSQNMHFNRWKQQADSGDAETQFYVGCCYNQGHGVPRSYKQAFHYYKLAADQGHLEAQLYTAFCYEYGEGVEQSDEEVFYYCQLAANQGDSLAQAYLGKLYEEGKGVEQSYGRALYYYRLAAEQDDLSALEYLMEAYEKGLGVEDSEEQAMFYARKILEVLNQEAGTGNPRAQFELGKQIEAGKGIEPSLELAFYYYGLAAEQNYLPALLRMARGFEEGRGVDQSHPQARYYYQLAADQGNTRAQIEFIHYLLGQGKQADNELAIRYLKLVIQTSQEASLRILSFCEYTLATCLEIGIGIKKSVESALHYYFLAADHGNKMAQKRLGDAYLKGELGLEVSTRLAIDHYQLAAAQEEVSALTSLAECYELGMGVQQSFEHAFHYYKLAAAIEQRDGYPYQAVMKLAKCYEEGKRIKPSLEKAIYYYRLAGEQDNNLEGYYRAILCYRKLTDSDKMRMLTNWQGRIHLRNKRGFRQHQQQLANELVYQEYKCLSIDFLKNKAKNFLFFKWFPLEDKLNMAKLYEENEEIEDHEKEAFKYCDLAAHKGYIPAQSRLGYYYREGIGVEPSDSRAFKYFKLAADQGEAQAQCEVGFCYDYGQGVEKSKEKAFHYYQLAADQGYMGAQAQLSYCYGLGKGTKESEELSLHYCQVAADQGYIPACDFMASHYSRTEQEDKYIKYLKIAAHHGDIKSGDYLATYYQEGREGLTSSDEKAFYYNKLAADQGWVVSQCRVGESYETGKGVEQSLEKAFHYYQLAAARGYPEGQYQLGFCYLNGVGIEKSPAGAFKYFKLAADQGHVAAQLAAAKCCEQGYGITHQRYEQAMHYYQLAADQGNEEAKENLEKLITKGRLQLQAIGKVSVVRRVVFV